MHNKVVYFVKRHEIKTEKFIEKDYDQNKAVEPKKVASIRLWYKHLKCNYKCIILVLLFSLYAYISLVAVTLTIFNSWRNFFLKAFFFFDF